jgi:TonB family protein
MNEERRQLLRGHLGRGMFLSFLAHASVIFPFVVVAIIFARREADNRDIEMRFEDVSAAELPDNLPELDTTEPPDRLAQRDDLDVVEPPPDQLPPPPEEQKETPPPVPVREKQNKKMVDLDMGKDVPPPPNAKYLAQKNNRAEEETRARDTNLEREQQGTEGSSPSDRKDEEVGDAKQKIAKLEDVKSKQGKSAPQVTPRTNPALPRPTDQERKSFLSMREAPKRDHEITPETADPSLERDPDGLKPLLEDRPESVRDLAGAPGSAQTPRLAITGEQYRYLFGDDAEAAERLAQTERSKKPGRFAERLGRIKSALENFIPEVRPGNQTALNTRAAPFAAFIARMHRSIHELWGFGFLEDLDSKPVSSPLNNPNLVTKLEIVLNADGTIGKVTIVRASGLTQFDAAAIDAVYSAGPFAEPPREIRSGNGKIYIHWTFHRDERQCATSGVDYYILDNAPPGADKGEPGWTNGLPTPGPSPERLKRLERNPGTPPRASGSSASHQAKRRQLEEAVKQAEGPEAAEEPDHDATRRAEQQVVRADDPAARATAAAFFDAYARGDIGKMLAHASFPFRSSAGVAAKNASELKSLLSALLEEAPAKRKLQSLELHSPAGARSALGGLPPGFNDQGGVVFATAEVSGETFVLVLAQRSGAWRAIGLVRR